MQAYALAIVCFKYGIEQARVISAVTDENGWIVPVVNNGIAGAPKIRMSPQEIEEVWVQIGRAVEGEELRGTFGEDGTPSEAPWEMVSGTGAAFKETGGPAKSKPKSNQAKRTKKG